MDNELDSIKQNLADLRAWILIMTAQNQARLQAVQHSQAKILSLLDTSKSEDEHFKELTNLRIDLLTQRLESAVLEGELPKESLDFIQ